MDEHWSEGQRSQWDPSSEDYRGLKEIRQEISVKWLEAFKLEKALARARSSLNKALRETKTLNTTTVAENTSLRKAELEGGLYRKSKTCTVLLSLLDCF